MAVTANEVAASQPQQQQTQQQQQHAFKSEREVIDYYTTLRQEVNLAQAKIAELTGSLREHLNVLENIKHLDPSRRCFRSVGGVLVERTVKEVMPAVEMNATNLQKAIDAIKEQTAVKDAEVEALRRKYKIREEGGDNDGSSSGAAPGAGGSGGVLA
jgi:prefoldin subunit 2